MRRGLKKKREVPTNLLAIRNAISIGGDSDTIGAITVGIAEAYYGIPEEMRAKAMEYLAERLSEIVVEFEGEYPVQK